MKPFFCKTAIALSLTLPAAANAAEYVCNVEGITVYASYQINDACRIVETNNVTETSIVAIPGDTPVLKTVQTTEFKASAADYVHASQATPAVQTPVVVSQNEYGIPAPISIPMAQIRQTVPTNKPSTDSVMVSNNTPALETPASTKPENNVVDTTVHNTVPVVQTQTTAVQADSTIVPPMLAAQTQPTVATDKAIADGVIVPNNTPTLEAPPTIKAEDYIADTTVRNTTPVAPAQPTASTEKTVSDGLAILNETTVAQPIVPAIQIPQEIVQNPTVQPQISAKMKRSIKHQPKLRLSAKAKLMPKHLLDAKPSSAVEKPTRPTLFIHLKNKLPNQLPQLHPNQAHQQPLPQQSMVKPQPLHLSLKHTNRQPTFYWIKEITIAILKFCRTYRLPA